MELVAHRNVRQASAVGGKKKKKKKIRLYHAALVVLQSLCTFSCVAARENITLITKLTCEQQKGSVSCCCFEGPILSSSTLILEEG